MKNIKYILVSLALVAVLVPKITFASWWNPFSWFNNWHFYKEAPIVENYYQENNSNPTTSASSLPLPSNESLKKTDVSQQVTPKDSQEIEAKQQVEKLLTSLRAEPFFDQSKTYLAPSDECNPEVSPSKNNDVSRLTFASSPGIFIGIDNEGADIHGYDNQGGHTGLKKIQGSDFIFQEESAQGLQFIKFGSHSYLSVHETIDAKVKLIGKKYGTALFEIRGDGNACGIVEIEIPITPHSIGILPITLQGDIGPFSYDIDGDDRQDFILSLLHPLLPEKQAQLDAVIADMKILQ